MTTQSLLVQIVPWIPAVVFGAGFVIVGSAHFDLRIPGRSFLPDNRHLYRRLAVILIGFRFLYALLLTSFQFLIWSGNAFSRLFLSSPLLMPPSASLVPSWLNWMFDNAYGYFLFYTWGRFWLDALLSVGIAFVWYFFLKFLARYKDRFFEEGEVLLGFVMALLVGWSHFTIFLVSVFLLIICISLLRYVVWGYRYTTMGTPFIMAGFVACLVKYFFP